MSVSTPNKHVIIVGGGVSGLGMACQLQRLLGHQDFTIYEKSSNIGGAWWHNRYPGCACDIPSHFYSYSFAMKPDWSKVYPERDELHAYIMSVAEKYDILRRTELNCELISADWDDYRCVWVCNFLNNMTGHRFVREAACLVSAVGTLDKPKIPQIKGAESFQGHAFHSARWRADVPMKGKNVVVLGNGASGTQFITPLVEQIGETGTLTQFVRSAHWWIKRGNAEYGSGFKALMRYVPGAARLYRIYLAWELDSAFFSFWMTPNGQRLRDQISASTKQYIDQKAPEEYKSILLPDYQPGCKRRVNTNTYLETLHKPNVHLTKDEVVEIRQNSVLTKLGKEQPADVIVYATGFQTQEWLFPLIIRGQDKKDLAKQWRDGGGAEAYKGTVISGFPNFFILYGPNAATGQHSVIFHSECQINYACRLMKPVLHAGAHSISVKKEAQKKDLEWVHSRMPGLVFNSGCQSWWLNPTTKKNTFIYPDLMVMYWLRTILPAFKDFEVRGWKRPSLFSVTNLSILFAVAILGLVALSF